MWNGPWMWATIKNRCVQAHNDACCTSALKVFMPILIGNVPLRVVYQNVVPSAPPAEHVGPSAPPLPAYPDLRKFGIKLPFIRSKWSLLAPPSYEEAVFGGGTIQDETDDENTTGPTSFSPRYPYYRFLSKDGAPTWSNGSHVQETPRICLIPISF